MFGETLRNVRRILPFRWTGWNRAQRPAVRARLDAVERNPELDVHYRLAEIRAADSEFNPRVRRELRRKVRHDMTVCGYLDGMCNTLSNRIVGEGPVINLADRELRPEILQRAELDWRHWARAAGLREKLRVAVRADYCDGESFLHKHHNPALAHFVKLGIRGIEADQVSDPDADPQDPRNVDGVILDRYGNTVEYRILETHPGADRSDGKDKVIPFPADAICHLAKRKRFGQGRGVTAFLAPTWLIAQRAEYIRNVVLTSRYQASRGGVLESDRQAGDASVDPSPIPGEAMGFSGTAISVAPYGWRFKPYDATQPNATLEMFDRLILQEIGRANDVPLVVVMLNSSGFNFASGRLDHLVFNRAIRSEQLRISEQAILPIFATWWTFWARAMVVEFPELSGRFNTPPVTEVLWLGGFEFLDIAKESKAYIDLVNANILADEDVWLMLGKDPETQREKVRKSAGFRASLPRVVDGSGGSSTPPPGPEGPGSGEAELENELYGLKAG